MAGRQEVSWNIDELWFMFDFIIIILYNKRPKLVLSWSGFIWEIFFVDVLCYTLTGFKLANDSIHTNISYAISILHIYLFLNLKKIHNFVYSALFSCGEKWGQRVTKFLMKRKVILTIWIWNITEYFYSWLYWQRKTPCPTTKQFDDRDILI